MDRTPRAVRPVGQGAASAAPSPQRADVWTLAFRRPPIGRDLLRQQLLASLTGDTRILTVVGDGGIGKSHLVAWAVRPLASRTAPRVVVVDAGELRSAAQVAAAALQQLGTPPSTEPTWGHLIAAATCCPTLLVIDDADQVADLGQELAEVVADASDLVTVVTRRTPFGLPGEVVLDVPRLPPAGSGAADDLRSRPAVALFLREAAFRGAVDPMDVGTVATICDELEGHPLAIELAAARIGAVVPATLLAQLRQQGAVSLLRGRRSTGPLRHRSLATTVEWTFDLLSPHQQRVLAAMDATGCWWYEEDLLGVVAATLGVAGRAVLAEVDELVAHRLVDLDTDRPELRVRPTRTARDLLAILARPDLDDARDRTRDALSSWLRAWCAANAFPLPHERRRRFPVLERWATEIDTSILAAHEVGDVDAVCHLALGAIRRWDANGVGRHLLSALHGAAAGSARGGRLDPRHRVIIDAWSLFFRAVGGVSPADAVTDGFDELVEQASQLDHLPTLLAVVGCSICAAQCTQRYDRARVHGEAALAAIEARGDDEPLAQFLLWQGMIDHQLGDADDAAARAMRALDIARERDDGELMAWALLLLGQLSRDAAGAAWLTRAVELARANGAPTQLAIMLAAQAEAMLGRGELADAALAAGEALRVAARIGDTSTIALVELVLVAIAAASRRPTDAATLIGVIEPLLPLLRGAVSPSSRAAMTAVLDRVRAVVGDADHDRLLAQGRAMTRVQAIAFAADVAASCASTPSEVATPASLTEREWAVLQHLAAGRTNKEIALALGIRSKTVTHHLSSAYRKLQVRNRAEAVRWVLDRDPPLDRAGGVTRR